MFTAADYAIEHQRFGGPDFNPSRMTWIKPSFAWVLYRSGYGRKHNQERILKIKISHKSMASILEECACKHGGGGSLGRVQWDPARDLFSADGDEPRKMLRSRAIQIGIKGNLSEKYVDAVLTIEDVTALAHRVGEVHKILAMGSNRSRRIRFESDQCASLEALPLPVERVYLPQCTNCTLERLGMVPGETADAVSALGRGKVGALGCRRQQKL